MEVATWSVVHHTSLAKIYALKTF